MFPLCRGTWRSLLGAKKRGGPPRTRATEGEYTAEERKLVIDYIDDELTVPQIAKFLRLKRLDASGNKADLLAEIRKATKTGALAYAELLELLDAVVPWGPQHVYLYGEPASLDVKTFRNAQLLERHLRDHGASRTLRARLPLILPDRLTLSSIVHTPERLRVTAVERRDGLMRDPGRDREEKTPRGERVQLRAWVEQTTRGLIMLDWNLIENVAMLQVTRLPSGWDYEDAAVRFAKLIMKWLDLSRFPRVGIRRAITTFHTEHIEKGEESRVKPHGVGYDTMAGGRVEAKTATARQALLDDEVAADSVERVRKEGVGRTGNFYWRIAPGVKQGGRGIHVKLLGQAHRVHFTTGNTEEALRHVLADIRSACG